MEEDEVDDQACEEALASALEELVEGGTESQFGTVEGVIETGAIHRQGNFLVMKMKTTSGNNIMGAFIPAAVTNVEVHSNRSIQGRVLFRIMGAHFSYTYDMPTKLAEKLRKELLMTSQFGM